MIHSTLTKKKLMEVKKALDIDFMVNYSLCSVNINKYMLFMYLYKFSLILFIFSRRSKLLNHLTSQTTKNSGKLVSDHFLKDLEFSMWFFFSI